MLDRTEIKAQMAKRDYTRAIMAKKLGISENTYVLKLKGKRKFTEDEITTLVHELGTSIFVLP